jgi:hypothetical protein
MIFAWGFDLKSGGKTAALQKMRRQQDAGVTQA